MKIGEKDLIKSRRSSPVGSLFSLAEKGGMYILQAVVLGIIQGLTEFLPISSSGHLLLAREVFGWELLADPHLNKLFDVALHTGTFFALVAYFWSDIVRLLKAFAMSFRYGLSGDTDRRLAWLMLVGTIPAAIAGVAGEEVIETRLGIPLLISTLLIVFGLVLWFAESRGRKQRALTEANWWDAILIGVAQATALAPGISRSGITLTAGLGRGMMRETAARFSFLLSIPIVGGTAAYSLLGLLRHPNAMPPGAPLLFLVGIATATISGYLCIRYFLRYLQTRTLRPFVIYRITLGVGLMVWFGYIK